MKILDLYCGAGGASMGISQAGHEVEGIDIEPQPDYPFTFYYGDAIQFLQTLIKRLPNHFDAYFASPPCQSYSYATTQWKNLGYEYPDLIAKTRELLLQTGKPFVIENVVGAPIRKDLMLCGSMFMENREYEVRRHRVFEIHGFKVPQPDHKKHTGRVGDGRVISVFGHGGGVRYNHCTSKLDIWRSAMNVPWMSKRRSITEAIPPDYTKYIFSFLGN